MTLYIVDKNFVVYLDGFNISLTVLFSLTSATGMRLIYRRNQRPAPVASNWPALWDLADPSGSESLTATYFCEIPAMCSRLPPPSRVFSPNSEA